MVATQRKALVAGWFSFEFMGASAGDLMACDVACEWLKASGLPVDVALAPPFRGGVKWQLVNPARYSHLVFVCGPIGNGPPVDELLRRFSGAVFVGLNLTMLQRLEEWNPFDLLWERDSTRNSRPDMAFGAEVRQVPVVGLIRIDHQPEYGARDHHQNVDQMFETLLGRREAAVVPIDTRLDENTTGLRTPAEVSTLIGRVDVVLTTRLHGAVLAIKAGVPPVVVDSVAGGAKVSRQALRLGWSAVLTVDDLTEESLERTFDWCLTEDGRSAALACRARAKAELSIIRDEVITALGRTAVGGR